VKAKHKPKIYSINAIGEILDPVQHQYTVKKIFLQPVLTNLHFAKVTKKIVVIASLE